MPTYKLGEDPLFTTHAIGEEDPDDWKLFAIPASAFGEF